MIGSIAMRYFYNDKLIADTPESMKEACSRNPQIMLALDGCLETIIAMKCVGMKVFPTLEWIDDGETHKVTVVFTCMCEACLGEIAC